MVHGTVPGSVGASLFGGTIVYKGSASGLGTQTGLTPGTLYYYQALSYDASYNYSAGVAASATTTALPNDVEVVKTSVVPSTNGYIKDVDLVDEEGEESRWLKNF